MPKRIRRMGDITGNEAANAARTALVLHGDHYAAYYAPSTDGEDIARAIEGLKV